MGRVMIPKEEYAQRVKNAAAKIREWGLDVLVVNGSEADYANTRYFSNFWPVFERCGVAISANRGSVRLWWDPRARSLPLISAVIDKVFALLEYRESANPAYPEFTPSKYSDVFKAIGVSGQKIKIGVAALAGHQCCHDGGLEGYVSRGRDRQG